MEASPATSWVVPNGGSLVVPAPSLVSDYSSVTLCVKAPMTVTPSTYTGYNTGTITIAANGFVGMNTLTVTGTDSSQSCSGVATTISIFVPTAAGSLGAANIVNDCTSNLLNGQLSGTISPPGVQLKFSTDNACTGKYTVPNRDCPACAGCKLHKEVAWGTAPAALSGLASDGQAYFGALWHAAAQRLYLNPFVATSQHANWLYIDASGNLVAYTKPAGIPTTTNYAAYYGLGYHESLQRLYFCPSKYYTDSTTWHYIDSTGNLQSYVHGVSGLTGWPAGAGYHPTLQRLYFGGPENAKWVYINNAGTAIGYNAPASNTGGARGFMWLPSQSRLYMVPWGTWGSSTMGYFDNAGAWTSITYPPSSIGNAGAPIGSATSLLNNGNLYLVTTTNLEYRYIDGSDGVWKSLGTGPGSMNVMSNQNFPELGKIMYSGDTNKGHLYDLIDSSNSITRIDLGGFYSANSALAYHPTLKRVYQIPIDVSTNEFSYIEYKAPPTCTTIYSDTLNDGSSSSFWHGSVVDSSSGTLGGTSSATWACTSGINAKQDGVLVGLSTGAFCALPFTPVDGHTYYVSVSLTTTSNDVNWGALLMLSSLALTNDAAAGRASTEPWALIRSDWSLDPNFLTSLGNFKDPLDQVTKITIKLDTTDSANWKATLYANGHIFAKETILSPKPGITYIAMGAHAATYTFSNFLLSDCRTGHLLAV